MACVFGEMRTLKTSERWAPKICPVWGEKAGKCLGCHGIAQRVPCPGRVGMKSLPRYAQDSENAPKPLLWQVLHQDATLSIPRPKELPLSVSVSA